jgi:hypothetical protein
MGISTTPGTCRTRAHGAYNDAGVLVISSSGAFLEPNALTNCILTGQFSLIDPNYNAYDVSFYPTGSDCELPGSYARGIATLDTASSPAQLEIAVLYYDSSGNPQGGAYYVETPAVQGGVWTAQSAGGGTALLLSSPLPSNFYPPNFPVLQEFNFYLQTLSADCAGLYTGGLYTVPGSTAGTYTVQASGSFNASTAGPSGPPAVVRPTTLNLAFQGRLLPVRPYRLSSERHR